VNADVRLDPDGELLPTDRYMELKTAATRRSSHLAEKKEARIVESEAMNDSAQQALPDGMPPSEDDDDIAVTAASGDSTTLRTKVESSMDLPKILRDACWVHTGTRADSNSNIFLSPILFRILFQTTHTLIL
jgi:hypothetical protein